MSLRHAKSLAYNLASKENEVIDAYEHQTLPAEHR